MANFVECLREAKWTVAALVALIVFWLLAGILGSRIEANLYNIPVWAVLGTLGVWAFAIVIAMTLSRNIRDTEL